VCVGGGGGHPQGERDWKTADRGGTARRWGRETERESVCVCVPELYGTANISAKGVVPSVSQAPQRYSLTGVCVCVCGGGGEREEREISKEGRVQSKRVCMLCVCGGGDIVWTRAEDRWVPCGPPRIRPRGPRHIVRSWDQ
jgi:hypothetical protein